MKSLETIAILFENIEEAAIYQNCANALFTENFLSFEYRTEVENQPMIKVVIPTSRIVFATFQTQ